VLHIVESSETDRRQTSFSVSQDQSHCKPPARSRWQFLRFSLVGVLNTLIDLLILNLLLWLWPARNAWGLVLVNTVAYAAGAINSFVLNRSWTFRRTGHTNPGEVSRFVLTTLAGIACNDTLLWAMNSLLSAESINGTLWTNLAKIVAIGGTVLVSFLGMRLWVFVHPLRERATKPVLQQESDHDAFPDQPTLRMQRDQFLHPDQATIPVLQFGQAGRSEITPNQSMTHIQRNRLLPVNRAFAPEPLSSHADGHKVPSDQLLTCSQGDQMRSFPQASMPAPHSLSIILPAYNEEQIIAATVQQVRSALPTWTDDFEIIVVNDGSTDQTGAIVDQLAEADAHVRVVTHQRNQGYGATLADGFAAARKELTFFMDSDGQFDIQNLGELLRFIESYDAVIGYRRDRQDTWMRKLNAWGWKTIVRLILGVHVRDIDCAFKVLRTDFLHQYPLETRGALINAELLFKLKSAGYTWKEVGVRHLPRQGGKATGANLRVIARAFRELFLFARKWRNEEKLHQQRDTTQVDHISEPSLQSLRKDRKEKSNA
jgi:putative flippase GtrA